MVNKMTCCDNHNKPPKILSKSATEEIENFLETEKLNILIAVGRNGKLLKINPDHFDSSALNIPNDDETISFVLKTKIPRAEMTPEPNCFKNIYLALRCKYGKSGGSCNPCL